MNLFSIAGVALWCVGGLASSARAQTEAFKVGDAVEAWNITWYKCHIVEVGTGKNQGKYLMLYDAFPRSPKQWFFAKNVRAIATPKEYSGPPRAGRYLVMGYSSPQNPIHTGYFVLKSGNQYRFYTMGDKLIGEGSYRFDATTKVVSWLSGPIKTAKWGGKFEITREGKTHTLYLNSTTLGVNSSDQRP